VVEECLGKIFEGGLGEELGFSLAGGVILFSADADAEDGVAFEDVEGSDEAADPEGFIAQARNGHRRRGFFLGSFFFWLGRIDIRVRFFGI